MKFTIDRIEKDIAIIECEDNTFKEIPISLLQSAHEGDVYKITKDENETKKRKENIKQMMDDLFKD